jgi:8-oxo-dGTP pyrophosphatase MutT (NUDIX family)
MAARNPTPTWFFALVVVRNNGKYLLAQERKYGRTWTIPGGRVEPGESLVDAAVREVVEETGIPVRLDGIVRIEHTPSQTGARVRVVFSGVPIDDTPPKQRADDESLGAAWLTLAEVKDLALRGYELAELLTALEAGAPTYPLELLGRELSV